jgi:hypothetical protein
LARAAEEGLTFSANESPHLGVFHKAIMANVHLLDELAALPRR